MRADRSSVLFSRFRFTEGTNVHFCTFEIVSVSLKTGKLSTLGRGMRPAISADGTKLAYVDIGGGKDCLESGPLVVRDMESGRERRWAFNNAPYGVYGEITHLAWSPDSFHLAYARNIGDPFYETRILDTRIGDDILDSKRVSPKDESWSEPAFVDAETLVVATWGPKGEDHREGGHRVESVAWRTGKRSVWVDAPAMIVSLDLDKRVRDLILVTVDHGTKGFARTVYRWRAGTKLSFVTRKGSPVQAVW